MFASISLLSLSLTLISRSYASPGGICKRGSETLGTPITLVTVLPTKVISSPPDAQCPVTYTTIVSSLCSDAAGTPTGFSDHAYTMTFGCQGSENSPCSVPWNPEVCPPGFMITTTVCNKCAGGPVTYTLTVPEQAAITGQPPEGSQGSENSPSPGEGGKPSSAEAQATEAVGNTPSGPNAKGGEGGGNASGSGQSSPSKAIEVSSGSLSVKGHVTRLVQISILATVFMGTMM
ncbi:uncharacterized protein FTJAE_10204 [Fusarium tjaetaba]|uniref:Uncharacterized protein n=1 Tax=Fusarium tjaetaba TaxID=1567544 RepID=A0A8H5QYD5_9HYPO|nr:uncharacterized protein FTJAE_10204 [Fusarium tjaetaba]KAF5624611.1 hypothetical protein FTJAE_10204 [Fusarium tjaetaba]